MRTENTVRRENSTVPPQNVDQQDAESRITQLAVNAQESHHHTIRSIVDRVVTRIENCTLNNVEKFLLASSILAVVFLVTLISLIIFSPIPFLALKVGLSIYVFIAIITIAVINIYAFRLHIPSVRSFLEKEIGSELKNHESYKEIEKWLNKIFLSKDYQMDPQGEAEKYRAFIQLANKDENYRNDIFIPNVLDANQSCGDRIGLYKIYLEMGTKLYQFSLDDYQDIAEYITQTYWSVNVIIECAKQRVGELDKVHKDVEEIEVYLFYLLQLKQPLELKIEVDKMMFSRLAKKFVTKENIECAKKIVIEKRANREECIRFLCNNSKWNQVLEDKFPKEMQALADLYDHDTLDLDEIIQKEQEVLLELTKILLPNFLDIEKGLKAG
ncbi:MAG: hypothetical protein ChlgKO_11580 [Chlamydiales bacterium]